MKSKSSSYAWVALSGLLVAFAVLGSIYGTVSMYISPILTKFPDISRAAYTITTTIQSGVTVIVSASLGVFVAKLGIRKMLSLGLLLIMLSQGLYSIANQLWMFYLCAAIYGVGMPLIMFVCGPTLVNSWFAKHTGLLTGLVSTTINLGGAAAGPIVGKLIVNIGYQGSFRIFAIVCGVAAVISFLLVRDRPAEGVGRWGEEAAPAQAAAGPVSLPGMTMAEARKTGKFFAVLGSAFLMAFCYVPCNVTLPILAADVGWAADKIGSLISVSALLGIALQVPCGILCEKFGSRYVLLFGAVTEIGAALILINIYSLAPAMLYAASILLGCGMIMILVPLQMLVREAFGLKEYGAILGLMSSVRTVGTALGVPAMQAIYDINKSYNLAFYIMIGLTVLQIMLVFYATSKKSKFVAAAV